MYIDCLWVSGQLKGQGYSNLLLNECISDSKEKGIPFKAIRFETTEQAQNAPAPFTSYSLFYNGEFMLNEILSDKKFETIIAEKGL